MASLYITDIVVLRPIYKCIYRSLVHYMEYVGRTWFDVKFTMTNIYSRYLLYNSPSAVWLHRLPDPEPNCTATQTCDPSMMYNTSMKYNITLCLSGWWSSWKYLWFMYQIAGSRLWFDTLRCYCNDLRSLQWTIQGQSWTTETHKCVTKIGYTIFNVYWLQIKYTAGAIAIQPPSLPMTNTQMDPNEMRS